jgi:hypothetical protein
MSIASLPKICAAAPSPIGTAARLPQERIGALSPLPTNEVRLTLKLSDW